MLMNTNVLKDTIDQMKKDLIRIAAKNGINSLDTLYFSQKLDKLIVIYQNCSFRKRYDH
ncbi:aspartyl-phosphate phosphatase Spo0E family protein [Niallia oryzisoli]|uniref:Aspartyl-phosphate phosphatase Spo0E family protein n=1 Tax=Niallia oryzisoli TaxID=1737571 RepID=A0ABZ2CCS0_9BACI